MKSSGMPFKRKTLTIFLAITVPIIIATVILMSLYSQKSIAFADEEVVAPPASDTFSVMFPTVSYIQSEDPALITANQNYLIVYDKTASAMFVRGGDRMGTYAFPLNLENVEYIKAVGNVAFIHADEQNYTVDLTDTSATPVKRELTSPDNANYFRSDGKYLYAKNGYGAVSIYDENLEIATFTVDKDGTTEEVTVDNHIYMDNTNNPVFAGKQVMAGNNHRLYFLTVLHGLPYFNIYDPVTKQEIANELMDCYVTDAYVGDNVVVAKIADSNAEASEPTPLVGLDKATGKVLFSSDITPDSFCVYGDRLFTIEGKQIITYTIQTTEDTDGVVSYVGFEKISTISMAGADTYHLDNPGDVIKFGNGLAVADTDNNRLGFISSASIMSTVSINGSPIRLTADSSGVYALCNDGKIIKTENDSVVKTLDSDKTKDTLDINYLDKLYLLKSDGLYTAIGDGIFLLAQVSGGRRIASAQDGTNLYILKDDGIDMFSSNGTLLHTYTGDFTQIVDFSVDYAGNIFALKNNGYEIYSTSYGTLAKVSETEFYNATAHANANSVCLDGQSLYFTAQECLVGKSTVEASTKDNYNPSEFIPSETSTYHFAKLKEDTASYVIPADGRMEAIYAAPTQTILVFDNDENAQFTYALLEGNFFQIKKSDYETVATNQLQGNYATNRITVFYALPDVESTKISVSMGTRISLFADCADFENSKWLRIKYNDKVYFVDAEHVDEYAELIPEKDRKYGKAKATRVGGLVNIYSAASIDSEVMTQIVDGTDVEVLEEAAGFYLIRYEEMTGYMLKDEVELKGLTAVQIASIVVACIVVIAGIGVFIAIEKTKKKAEDDARKAEKRGNKQ